MRLVLQITKKTNDKYVQYVMHCKKSNTQDYRITREVNSYRLHHIHLQLGISHRRQLSLKKLRSQLHWWCCRDAAATVVAWQLCMKRWMLIGAGIVAYDASSMRAWRWIRPGRPRCWRANGRCKTLCIDALLQHSHLSILPFVNRKLCIWPMFGEQNIALHFEEELAVAVGLVLF